MMIVLGHISFKPTFIRYLDYVVLNFLRQMPMFRSINNSSSNNNILSMSICFADTRVMQLALGYLMPQPLFNGIGAFNFWADTYNLFPHFLDNFRNNFLPAKFLYLDAAISVPTVNPIVRWLSTRVTDSEPRIAIIQKSTVLIWRNLSEAIRQVGVEMSLKTYFNVSIDNFPANSDRHLAGQLLRQNSCIAVPSIVLLPGGEAIRE
jgi:hypothetical protein